MQEVSGVFTSLSLYTDYLKMPLFWREDSGTFKKWLCSVNAMNRLCSSARHLTLTVPLSTQV